jgi:hypothetical protein
VRTFFLPVNTGYSSDGDPSDRAVEFYRERSGNNLYAAIVGNVVLPAGVGTNDVCMRISDRSVWSKLALAINEEGAIPGVQLSSTWDGYVGIKHFKPTKGSPPFEYYRQVGSNFTRQDVDEAFANLRRGTELAIKAGFRHVQLHGAHGYLFSLLLDPVFSFQFGRSLEKVSRWVDFLKGEGIESSIRVSVTTGMPEADDGRETTLGKICELTPDFMDLSDGYYNANKHLIYPSHAGILRARHLASLVLAGRFPGQQFIISGWASSLSLDEPNLNLGICRDLIANPMFLTGGSGCKNKMLCHFYSRGVREMSCGEWG